MIGLYLDPPQHVAVVASFLALVGVPFIVAACLDALAMRKLVRVALIAAIPVGLATLLFTRSWGLDEIGVVLIARAKDGRQLCRSRRYSRSINRSGEFF